MKITRERLKEIIMEEFEAIKEEFQLTFNPMQSAEKKEAEKLGFGSDDRGMKKYYNWVQGGRLRGSVPKDRIARGLGPSNKVPMQEDAE
tara:strand:+ start:369 stop:635 length:267 start_codon:yes stop_codon:yes gene_type:complete